MEFAEVPSVWVLGHAKDWVQEEEEVSKLGKFIIGAIWLSWRSFLGVAHPFLFFAEGLGLDVSGGPSLSTLWFCVSAYVKNWLVERRL